MEKQNNILKHFTVICFCLLSLIISLNCRRNKGNNNPAGAAGSTGQLDTTNDTNGDITKKQPIFDFIPDGNETANNKVSLQKQDAAGNIITFKVELIEVNSVFGAAFDLNYDSLKLKYIKGSAEQFLKQDGSQVYFQGNGKTFTITRFGTNNVSGSGILCSLQFEAMETFNFTDTVHIIFERNEIRTFGGGTTRPLIGIKWYGGIVSRINE